MNDSLRIPLFSRLTASKPIDPTLDNYLETIRQEVEAVLNSRLPVPIDALQQDERSIVTYGIPDLPHFSGQSYGTWHQMCDFIARTIMAFEPRLTAVEVRAKSAEPDGMRVTLEIVADLRDRREAGPISFDIQVKAEGR